MKNEKKLLINHDTNPLFRLYYFFGGEHSVFTSDYFYAIFDLLVL